MISIKLLLDYSKLEEREVFKDKEIKNIFHSDIDEVSSKLFKTIDQAVRSRNGLPRTTEARKQLKLTDEGFPPEPK